MISDTNWLFKGISPFGEMLPPFGERLTPFGENMTPFGEEMTPFGENMTPFGERLTPFGENMTPFGEDMTPFGEKLPPFGEMLFNDILKVISFMIFYAFNNDIGFSANHANKIKVNKRKLFGILMVSLKIFRFILLNIGMSWM